MKIFKPATSTSDRLNLFKTLIQSIFLWVLTLFLLPGLILWLEPDYAILRFEFPYHKATGIFLFVLFALLNFWSGLTMATIGKGTPLPMDCATRLVIRGPYAWVRNPMAVSGLGLGFSIAIFLGSNSIILYVVSGLLIWNFFVRPMEEKDLAERFGSDFETYQQNVWCWIPRIKPYRPK